MTDALYARELLRLAAAATGAGRLERYDAQGNASNPICGDRVAVTLTYDSERHIAELAHETRACVLAQASAAILAAHLPGASREDVVALRADVQAMLGGAKEPPAPYSDYAALRGAAEHRNRHTCVLLPLDAVLDALNKG